MEFDTLRNTAKKITMPKDMKQRIARNCSTQISIPAKEHTAKTGHNNSFLRKPTAVLISFTVCISLAVTALAAAGVSQGYFRDIINFYGAITGTAYEQASDEIHLHVTVNGEDLTVLATFTNPMDFPYRDAEKLGIAAYQIVDAKGKAVKEGEKTDTAQIKNGQASISIPLTGIESGEYQLIISTFVSEKKADQPLHISGIWECSFTK